MKGVDIVVGGSVGHMSAFMAQGGRLVVLRRRRRRARRLALRGAALRARRGRGARRRLRREGAARRARDELRGLLERAGMRRRRRRRVPPLRLGAPALPLPRRQRGATDGRRTAGSRACASPQTFDRDDDRRDPARRARGHLRHPRLGRQAPRAPFRRPAVPRRERVALPARGLPRALRHRRRARHAPRQASRSSWRSRSRSPA